MHSRFNCGYLGLTLTLCLILNSFINVQAASNVTAKPPNSSNLNQNIDDSSSLTESTKSNSGDDSVNTLQSEQVQSNKSESAAKHLSSRSDMPQARVRSVFLDLTQLNLSDEQKQKILDMRSQNSLQAHQTRQAMRAKKIELRNFMFDPKSSEVQIRTSEKQLNELQGKLADIAITDFLYIRSILTADQKQKLLDLKQKSK